MKNNLKIEKSGDYIIIFLKGEKVIKTTFFSSKEERDEQFKKLKLTLK